MLVWMYIHVKIKISIYLSSMHIQINQVFCWKNQIRCDDDVISAYTSIYVYVPVCVYQYS